MMNQMIGRLALAVSAALLLFTSVNCNESTLLGEGLIPDSDRVSTLSTDTFTVHTRTWFRPDDSMAANYQTEMTAGAINDDPVFGRSVAITYSQFGLSTTSYEFEGDKPVLDSVVLSLGYAGYYGDSLGAQQFTVYKILDKTFSDTTLYYTHQQLNIESGHPLGTAVTTPKGASDSVDVYGTMEAPQIRIRLDNAFGQSIMQQSPDGALSNDSTFHAWLNGLAIVPDSTTPGRRALLFTELNSDYTGITVFYHNESDDSLQAFFPFNVSSCAFSNYVRRDYTNSEASHHFGDTVDVKGDSLIYLQGNPGLYADIDIPYLQYFPNAVINKAELIITQIPDAASGVFPAPDWLFLWQYKNAAKDSMDYVVDVGAVNNALYGLQLTNLSYFDGSKRTITNKDGQQVAQYHINITRYLQHLIRDNPTYPETNFGFRLVVLDASGSTRDPGRIVVGGGTHGKYPMKLHVVYTKIE